MTEMKTLQPGIDFSFMINEKVKDEDTAIMINNGPFEGVTYRYNRVWVDETLNQTPEGDMVVNFDYSIINNKGNEDLQENLEFKAHISNILQTIILEGINRAMVEDPGT